MPQVRDVRSPSGAGRTGEISKDRHSARIVIELRTTDPEKAKTLDGPVAAALSAANTRHPGIAIEEFGGHSLKQFDDAVSHDFAKAGEISLPLTLAVLVIAFGELVAAGLPLLLALTAVIATTGLLALPSKLIPLDPQVGVIVLLIGLAVGVDYAMFYLKREREERAARPQRGRGRAGRRGHVRACRFMVPEITVIVAMAGMLFTRDKTFTSFGLGRNDRGCGRRDRVPHRVAGHDVAARRPSGEVPSALGSSDPAASGSSGRVWGRFIGCA